ncbi:methyltransferase domain-containing protein [Alkalihalobacterium bogoriense]|uniref:methyltransferase domain-containing protein n=1 Tax=Alkalihalobacterium bogoriense TaxID=246272 RepID=UPI000683FEDB|nr:methyltransferase domain-containing protein [Alkalihalobacterium bogoriense]
MSVYTCSFCQFTYDEWHGDSKNGIPKQTQFSVLSGSLCSRCGMQGERHQRQRVTSYKGEEAKTYDMFAGKAGISFYMEWLHSSKDPVTVLELGSGTGRMTVPFLQKGIHVQPVDVSNEMNEIAKKKLERLDLPITIIEEDILSLHLEDTYSHILLADGFLQHFLMIEEQKKLLAFVYSHIKQGGQIALDIIVPPNTKWKTVKKKRMTNKKTVMKTIEGEVTLSKQLMVCATTITSVVDGYIDTTYHVEREYSLLTPREVVYLLEIVGFDIINMTENYKAQPWETVVPASLQKQKPDLPIDQTLVEQDQDSNLHPYVENVWSTGHYIYQEEEKSEWTTITIFAKKKEER